jgi:hypothetical protein
MTVDTEKMERVLASNWTQFIDARALLREMSRLAAEHLGVTTPVSSAVISRFELAPQGFIVWVDFTTSQVHGTSEFFLSHDGNFSHSRTLRI